MFAATLQIICLGCLFAARFTLAERPIESFSEALHIRRLDDFSVGLRFEFVSRKLATNPGEGSASQFEIFPKVIDQVISNNVSDVRLVMTRGTWRWRAETLWPSVETGAPGVELWARVGDPDRGWTQLVRFLAGMTCASLDGLQHPSAFGKTEDGVLFAHLPSETVCTENIPPWLKLLPCRNRAGLGRLIAARTVVKSDYYSLVLSTRRTSMGSELIQSLSVVLPLKDSLLETLQVGSRALDTFLSCNLASKSEIVIEAPNTDVLTGGATLKKAGRDAAYTVLSFPLDEDVKGLLQLKLPSSTNREADERFHSVKWQSGGGDMRGTFSTALYNENPSESLRVRHVELLPSFLRPRFETVQVRIGANASALTETELRSRMRIFFSLLRGPPTRMEFDLILPPRGETVLITYSFNKAFLFFDEFPPNPNRGFDVPSAVTLYNRTVLVSDTAPDVYQRAKLGPVRRATQALLVSLAHPDFSMPYNVITLSSTGFALFFGMLVNISVRKRGDRWVRPAASGETRVARVKRLLLGKCRRRPKEDSKKE